MKFNKMEKRQLLIYVIVAYGVTYLMGLLMWYAYVSGKDVSVFPNAQMMYPAAGVMAAYLITRKTDKDIPKKFFISYLVITVLLLLCTVLSTVTENSVPSVLCAIVMAGGSVVCGCMMLIEENEKLEHYGLRGGNGKASVFCIILFVLLYVLRAVIADGMSGELWRIKQIAANPSTWFAVFSMGINFFLCFIAFFGEEYGWRYFLQPLLQHRCGKRAGVLLLGVVWGIWHLPVNAFYYSTPDTALISIAGQQITCITLGIFFAYAYMKTQNIWVPVILHFLNNNMIPIISGTYRADVLQGQSMSWGSLIPALVLNGVLFGGFILAKEFRKEKIKG